MATGKNGNTCNLNGISAGASSYTVHVFVRTDNKPLSDLGISISQALCALFTGTFSLGCSPYVTVDSGPFDSFSGFEGLTNGSPNLSWGIYTSGAGSYLAPGVSDNHLGPGVGQGLTSTSTSNESLAQAFFSNLFDILWGQKKQVDSTYAQSGPFYHPQCGSAITSYTPTNYGSVCDPTLDNLLNEISYAPCFSALGDPIPGQTNPTVGYCNGTNQMTLESAAYWTEDWYGKNVFSLPVFVNSNQYAYRSNWQRAINGQEGTFNYFTWLNAFGSSTFVPGLLRQGFSQSPVSLNPYIAESPWDLAILRSIYDSLGMLSPMRQDQLIDWMTYRHDFILNSALGYAPPSGTTVNLRYRLRGDIFWQDGEKLTAWDVKFSFASLRATGSLFSAMLREMICVTATCSEGITVRDSTTLDVHLSKFGRATSWLLGSVPILPGKWWSSQCSVGTTWHDDVQAGNVPDGCMQVDSNKAQTVFDPTNPPSVNNVKTPILIGSGPWECLSSGGIIGGPCSSSNTQIVPAGGTFTFTRFGKGTTPGANLQSYFRSNGNLALYLWTGNNGRQDTSDFNNLATMDGPQCFGKPVGTVGCTRWQEGIGNPSGDGVTCCVIGQAQISIVVRFYQLNWVMPFDWWLSPPQSIATVPPTLYEGQFVLLPASIAGCTKPYSPSGNGGGYDC